jgi:hypothetical protein
MDSATLLKWAGQLEGMAEVLRSHGHLAEAIESEILAKRLTRLAESKEAA